MSGILASADLLNGPNQAIYINNRTAATVATINICNRNTTRSAKVRVAISSTEGPSSIDWVEFDTEIGPKGVLERSGLWISPSQYLVVRSDLPNVSAVVWGATKGTVNTSAPGLTPVTAGTVSWATNSTLAAAPRDLPYRAALVATDSNGGTVFYSLQTGSTLPSGMGLSTDGILEGTPTVPANYFFTIIASNGTNSVTRTFSLNVISLVASSTNVFTLTTAGGFTTHTFTGTTATFTASTEGLIEIYAWGGGGAGGTPGGWSFGANGGAGGYVSGTYRISSGETLHIIAGSGGIVNSTSEVLGGGGIASLNLLDNRYGSGGGGYSGVFFNNNFRQQNVLIMAGGGGGGGSSRAGAGNVGGAGGGLIGQNGVSPYDDKLPFRGNGGTQTAAGANATSDAINNPSNQGDLRGGSPRVNSYGGAGGGGYWGGSGGGYSEPNTMGGGGGGSGYIHPLITNGFAETGNLTTPGGNNALRGFFGNAGSPANNGANGGVIIRYRSL